MRRAILCAAAACLTLAGCVSADVSPPAPERLDPPSVRAGYAYTLLKPQEQAAYRALCAAAEAFSTAQTPLDPPVEGEALARAWEAARLDRPEFYWASCPAQQGRAEQFALTPAPGLDPQQARERQQRIDEAAQRLLAGIEGRGAKAAAEIHDALLAQISYREGEPDAGNLYGGLALGRGVCGGYSAAYQYLLQQQGIECALIQGRSVRGIPHSWNAVALEDGWYYADPTWNDRPDGSGEPFHDYLFLTLEEFSLDHFPSEGQYSVLPPADSDRYCYYRVYGYCADADAPDLLAEMAKGFARQIADRAEQLRNNPTPLLLEIKLFGSYRSYEAARDRFTEGLFPLLAEIERELKLQGIPAQIQTTGYLEYDYNDTTQVLNLSPRVFTSVEKD